MRKPRLDWILLLLATLAALLLSPSPGAATDVDGPDDCTRTPIDFGDAPEDILAYPGVTGHFPTCRADGAPGTMTTACPPGGGVVGPTGFVAHAHNAAGPQYWLGCGVAGLPPQGIDGEGDGKVNDTGGPFSACNPTLSVDGVEAAFGMTFGQDESTGDDDAGIGVPVTFGTCASAGIAIRAYHCGTTAKQVVLNVLVDWNHDGDWNDVVQCPAGGCVREWAVQNAVVVLAPGCNLIPSPFFPTGPTAGPSWMRLTLSDDQAPADFTWNGSKSAPGQMLTNGETEDYPVRVVTPPTCPSYQDWGDAPEEALAYPGVPGHFPTCSAPNVPGTIDIQCAPRSTPPGPTGFVRHLSSPNDNVQFWLGCGDGAASLGVDGESDGKMNDDGSPLSRCNQGPVDSFDFFGINWGQDESYGDGVDAGLDGPVLKFRTCANSSFDFHAYNCKAQPVDAFLNVLIDMNQDGDWNDNFQCPGTAGCAYEWAIKNIAIPLMPGCQKITTPIFLMGPMSNRGWMRITLSAAPVSDNFPWDGSAGPNGDGFLLAGETEDYPVMIRPDNVGVGDEPTSDMLALAPLAPNPAGNQVMVKFTLPQADNVTLAAFDVAGRKLADLAQGRQEAGEHRVSWNFTDRNGRSVAAGYYLIKLRVGNRVLIQRGIRVR
jgi:hypothetical protein